MSKKDFIALADMIREYDRHAHEAGTNCVSPLKFGHTQLLALAEFCHKQNPRFMKYRWLDYIAGRCGKNGGVVKHESEVA